MLTLNQEIKFIFRTKTPASVFLPAVCHYGPGIRRVEELDLPYEAQQSGGVTGDAVVGPAGEVKLAEFTDLVMTLLRNTQKDVLCISQWQIQEKMQSLCEKLRPFIP